MNTSLYALVPRPCGTNFVKHRKTFTYILIYKREPILTYTLILIKILRIKIINWQITLLSSSVKGDPSHAHQLIILLPFCWGADIFIFETPSSSFNSFTKLFNTRFLSIEIVKVNATSLPSFVGSIFSCISGCT